jgi:HK97 family phage prohead protease
MAIKALSEVKAEGDAGYVEAVFSTFDVIDHDNDVTRKGAFEQDAPVRVSAYNHASWGGALPVGRGSITSDDSKATFAGQFFMGTTPGRDTFETVKAMGDLGEWSYGFDIIKSSEGEHDGKSVRFLEELKVHEVSPVLLGAGVGTHTVVAKAKQVKDLSDEELAEQALEACKALLDRGLSLPEHVVEAVRRKDAETLEAERRDGSLRAIAAIHGIPLGGG